MKNQFISRIVKTFTMTENIFMFDEHGRRKTLFPGDVRYQRVVLPK